ncbi:GNAT family N-acetyltransferase [Niallia sp.]|uniref:GNAT family N-acetyltransferase n=1 Tax=Niallia sp. TaxID=2837523 RepID=UPI0028A2190A|nr:GNAT family N-acetyltransferase [Niallia sp.]
MINEPLIIKELRTVDEWKTAFPVMKQLRTKLDINVYLELVSDSVQKQGYRLIALYNQKEIVALCGFMPMITLYNGRFVWVCELITDRQHRSKGYGKVLLEYVHQWAIDNDYPIVSLSSGLQRIDAHRFYEEKMEYEKVSYVYLKRL